MSLSDTLHAPTRNSAWYLFPWNLLVFYLIALVGVGMSLGLLMGAKNWLMASLLFNLFLVSVVGMMAREQLTYAFVACLPNYQPAVRRHLVLVGIAGNVLLLLVGLLSYQVPAQQKLDTAIAFSCGGMALYFVLSRVILSIPNLGYWNLFFTALLLIPSLSGMNGLGRVPYVVPLNDPLRVALPLLALFSLWWFWQLLARPKHFRKVMDLPVAGGFDCFNTREGFFATYDLVRKATERRRESSVVQRWVATVGIPGHSCVGDHLNVVVNRALSMLVSPAFWLMAALLCVFQAWLWSRGGPQFAPVVMLYPMVLLAFTLKSAEVSLASPLLPYSRLERAFGVLAASLLSLVLFFAFMWVTWRVSALLGPLLNQNTAALTRVRPSDIILAILLWVPAYYMVQLLLSLVRNSAVFVITILGTVCMIATVITIGAISASHKPGAEVHLLWWFVVAWGLYLIMLYLRFRRGSLDPR